MVKKKKKKIKKKVWLAEPAVEKGPEAEGAKTVARNDQSTTVSREDYIRLKKSYLILKRKHQELEVAFNRIGVLEQDIKRVHEKIDSIDASGETVEKELKAVKSRVNNIQQNVHKIAYVATKVSKRYGVPAPPTPQGQRPTGVQRAPQTDTARSGAPPKGPGGTNGRVAMTKAAKALAHARGTESAQVGRGPITKAASPAGRSDRPVSPKRKDDEITVEPTGNGKTRPKDHRDLAERMDAHDVITDPDDEAVDYLVKEGGRTQPLDKKLVEKAIKEKKEEERK